MRSYSWSAFCLFGVATCGAPPKPAHDPNASGYDGSMVPAAAQTEPERMPEAPAPLLSDESMADNGSSPNSMPLRDQGKSRSDLITTQRIREAVIMNDSLSFSATKLQIVTSEGKVTLSGTVSSARERAVVEDIAKEIAGPYNVDNKIELQSGNEAHDE